MKKFLALVLALVMVFCLVACGNSTADPSKTQAPDTTKAPENNQGSNTPSTDTPNTPAGKTKITVGLSNSFNTVTPFQNLGLYLNYVLMPVYLRLGQRDNFSEQEMVNILMKDYKRTEDKTYEVTILEGIYDHEGNPITAADVAFCYNYLIDTKYGVGSSQLTSVEATGDYTLKFVLKNDALGDFITVCEGCGIVSQKAFEASSDGMATQGVVGTGPYKLVEFISGSRIVLEKDEDFWANKVDHEESPVFAQNVDVIEYNFLTEPVQMQAALETDTIQFGLWVNEAIVEDVKEIKGLTVESLPSPQICAVLFNQTDNSPCKDENLRKAIATCINSEMLVENVLYGVGETAKYFGKEGTIGNNPDWANQYDNYPFDVDKAKEYLAASSYNGEDLAIIIMGNTTFRTASQVVQANMQAIGIKCHIDEYDMSTWNKYIVANSGYYYDITLQNYSIGGPYLIQTLAKWLDGRRYDDGCNTMGMNDPELQAIIDKLNSEDWTQEDYDALQAYIQDTCCIYAHYNNKFTYACNDRLGVTDDDRGAVNGEIFFGAIDYPDDWDYLA